MVRLLRPSTCGKDEVTGSNRDQAYAAASELTFAEDPGGDNDCRSIRALPQRGVGQGVCGSRGQADVTRLQRGRIAVGVAAVNLELEQTSTCGVGLKR